MREKILKTVEDAFIIAEKFYIRKFDRPTDIEFKRNGTVGGHCYISSDLKKRELMFQLDLAENHPDHYMTTVYHEVAHYIQFLVYATKNGRLVHNIKAHGREWKFVMEQVYKLPATRCHSYDTNSTVTKRELRHTYGCACEGKTFKLSTTMHNRLQNDLHMNPIQKWNADYGSYTTGKYYSRRCARCGMSLILIKAGDPNEKHINDLKKKLEILQRRLDNQKQFLMSSVE